MKPSKRTSVTAAPRATPAASSASVIHGPSILRGSPRTEPSIAIRVCTPVFLGVIVHHTVPGRTGGAVTDLFTNHRRFADLDAWHAEVDDLRARGVIHRIDET